MLDINSKMHYTPGCLCQGLAGPAAGITNDDDDVTELTVGAENDVSTATATGALLLTANRHMHLFNNTV